jgi:hypothetical protein
MASENTYKSLINRLSEIRNDEENHVGILLQCIQLLDPEVMRNGMKGLPGEEPG